MAWTRGSRMEGTVESTELWWGTYIVLLINYESCKSWNENSSQNADSFQIFIIWSNTSVNSWNDLHGKTNNNNNHRFGDFVFSPSWKLL